MLKTFLLLFIFIALIGLTSHAQPQNIPWERLQSPVNSTLRSLSFVDSLTGWAAGESGTIIHTSDGGENWEIQNSTVQTFITDIYFSNDQNGWAVTLKDVFPFNTVVLKTTNGGSDWIAEDFQDTTAFMRTIFFFDSLNGFIGGSYIACTTNGGSTWQKSEVDSNMVSSFPVYKFNFFNRQFGYACGGRIDIAGVVWRTTNSGLNWTAQGISPDEIFDIYIIDSLNAVTLSGDPEGFFGIANLRTNDAGITWNYNELLFFGLSFSIDFRTYNEGWSASGFKFIFTSDRGENWIEVETPDSSIVYDLQFLDARNGYAVGGDGTILKLNPDLVNIKDDGQLPASMILYQNYPNPFNPSTRIEYEIFRPQFVAINVYDLLGNKIANLVNEEKPPGKYHLDFNPELNIKNPVSGIYFYQMKTDDCIQTKKMVYLK
jgi:photosystem II stability/assembly factor-like uncharacterized protein